MGKFSGYDTVTSANDDDLLLIDQVPITPDSVKKITKANLLQGISGSSVFITVAPSGGDYTDIQSALDAIGTDGGDIYVKSGTYTVTSTLLVKKSRTKLICSLGAIIQCDGSLVSPLIKPNTTGLQGIYVTGGQWSQTNATAQGTAFDFSDAANCQIEPTRITIFGLGLELNDTVNTTFYNHFRNIQIFDCNNGINIGGNPVNNNTFTSIRVRPKAGGAGIGLNLTNGRDNTFVGCNFEPATGAGITGVSLGSSAHYNVFVGIYVENCETNLAVNASANRNAFIGGNISSPVTTNISDSSTTTAYYNVNDDGVVKNNPAALTGTLTANDINLTTGAALRTRTSAGNTIKLSAFDVDGAAYTTFATLTANNTPTMDLDDAVTKSGQYIYRVGGTDVAVADGGTGNSTGTATINANMTGDVTSVGNATTIGAGKVTEAMQVLADNTTNDFSTTKHGYVPKGPNTGKFLKDDGTWASIPGGGDALTTNPLSQFASTTSLQLKGVLSDETGSGAAVFADTPTLIAPILGTPTSGVATNLTGTASGLTAGTVTTNANLTGDVTSSGNATTLGAVVTNAKLSTSAGEPGAAWASFTPTLSGRLDDGDWTKSCAFQQIGKTVIFRVSLTATAAAPAQGGAGEFTFTLPTTSVSYPGTASLQPLGDVMLFDANGTRWEGKIYWATTTTAFIRYSNVSGTGNVNAACSATVPFTWTTSDQILCQGAYETA